MQTEYSKQGTCGCRLCGLRGHSKNVRIRSIFPIYPPDKILLETYERTTKVHTKDGLTFYSSTQRHWNEAGFEDETPVDMSDIIVDYLKSPGAAPEDFKMIFCAHEWVQDPGTETV